MLEWLAYGHALVMERDSMRLGGGYGGVLSDAYYANYAVPPSRRGSRVTLPHSNYGQPHS